MRHHARASIVLALALPAACLPVPTEHSRGGFGLGAPDALDDDLTAAPRHLRALEEATDDLASLLAELLREGAVGFGPASRLEERPSD